MKFMHFFVLVTGLAAVVTGSGNSPRLSRNICIRFNALRATL